MDNFQACCGISARTLGLPFSSILRDYRHNILRGNRKGGVLTCANARCSVFKLLGRSGLLIVQGDTGGAVGAALPRVAAIDLQGNIRQNEQKETRRGRIITNTASEEDERCTSHFQQIPVSRPHVDNSYRELLEEGSSVCGPVS